MLFRLRALYLRYAAHHADRLGGFSLPRDQGRKSGHVERVVRARGATRVIGWTAARTLTLSWSGGTVEVSPSIQRSDVTRRFKLPLETGFEIEVPDTARDLKLTVPLSDGRRVTLDIPHPSDPPTPAAHRRLRRAFVRDLIVAAPSALRWMRRRDPADRTRIKRLLGLEATHPAAPIDARYLGPSHAGRADGPITIVLPVHNAFDMLTECLKRVALYTDLPWHMVLIDDASSDDRVRPLLRDWAAAQGDRVILIELDENLGFVGAANRGLVCVRVHTPGTNVVLLNSDALVPAGWASRLLAPIEADAQTASVTPMSNDAELFSVPLIVQRGPLPAGHVDRIDAVAESLSYPRRLPSAPTGVGFCMAMNAAWLAKVPHFDADFGRGYGEEVDWCQKTRHLGARHVGVPTLFVEHAGAQSFGPQTKPRLVARANAMIARRYPSYDIEVQSFIGRDPLATPRLALAIAQAGFANDGPLPIYVAHSLGGGAEHALMDEIADRVDQGQSALVLRVGGAERWQLEQHGPLGVIAGTTGDLALIRQLLAPVPQLRIIYSCGVGDGDPVELPDLMRSLMRTGRHDTLAARVHDFFMVSPSYCLLDSDGRFLGAVHNDRDDPAHRATRPDGSVVALAQWQAAWHRFLASTDDITVFSRSSRDLLLASYPDLAPRIIVKPHRVNGHVAPVRRAASAPRTLGILGNLNFQKGAAVLCDLAARLPSVSGPRLVVIGNVDAGFSLPRNVKLHGSYAPTEISALTERYGITDWLIPSIWPETFSFVTHEMLATGLPVFGFDIGAQGETLAAHPNGHPIAFHADDDHATLILVALQDAALRMQVAPA